MATAVSTATRRAPMGLPARLPQWGIAALVIGSIAFAGTAVLIVQSSLETAAGYAVQGLRNDKTALESDNQRIEADVASLKSLDRIEQQATGQLKMIKPSTYVYITVDMVPPGYRVPGDPQQAASVPAPAATEPWWSRIVQGLFGQRGEQ